MDVCYSITLYVTIELIWMKYAFFSGTTRVKSELKLESEQIKIYQVIDRFEIVAYT